MDKKKPVISLRTRILITGIISLCTLIIGACAIIGYQVYQINVAQYEQTTTQQFATIKQTILLFMQNNENTVKMLAEHPSVQVADESLNSYINAQQDSSLKNITRGQKEQVMAELFKRMHDNYPDTAEVFNGADSFLRGMERSKQGLIPGGVHGICKRSLQKAIQSLRLRICLR